MSAEVIELYSPWQQCSDAIDLIEEFLGAIPEWTEDFDCDYELAAETQEELREAAALLQRAVALVRRGGDRETPRFEAVVDGYEARGVPAPWDERS